MSDLLPPFLYRYYSGTTRNIESIAEGYLWFSSLDKMNDPFEGAHFLDESNLNISSAKSIIRRTLIRSGMVPALAARAIDQKLKHLKTEKLKLEFLKHSIRHTHETAYEELIKQGYCCMIGEDTAQEESLTDAQLILMWGHYGQGLAGFRIEFETNGLIDSLSKCQEVSPNRVNYTTSPPGLDPTKVFSGIHLDDLTEHQIAQDAITPCVTTKHVAWKYEQEIRLNVRKPGKVKFNQECIKELVIGSKMDHHLRKSLIQSVKNIAPKASLKLAKLTVQSRVNRFIARILTRPRQLPPPRRIPRDSSSRRICHPRSAGTGPTCSAARPYRALIRSTTCIS